MMRLFKEFVWRLTRKYSVQKRKHISEVGTDVFYCKKRKYAGHYIYPQGQYEEMIISDIKSGRPYMAARFGGMEEDLMRAYTLHHKDRIESGLKGLCYNAGFFPQTYEWGGRFAELMLESCKEVDYLAQWNLPMEAYFVRKYIKKEAYLTFLRYLEPWYGNKPWTHVLEGKNVLVIHPFSETIERQYKNREYLFSDQRVLPRFNLITLKSVQTMANQTDERFDTWFDALEWMFQETQKFNYDIALIGCGAYGFPLAAKIKQSGKQAIHMGGVLQCLFGIKGRRWDNDPVVSQLYNEYWVRPSENEKPSGYENIEEGCYW